MCAYEQVRRGADSSRAAAAAGDVVDDCGPRRRDDAVELPPAGVTRRRHVVLLTRHPAPAADQEAPTGVSGPRAAPSGRQQRRRRPRAAARRRRGDDVTAVGRRSRDRRVVGGGHDGSRAGDEVRVPVLALPRQQADLHRPGRLRLGRRAPAAPHDRPNVARLYARETAAVQLGDTRRLSLLPGAQPGFFGRVTRVECGTSLRGSLRDRKKIHTLTIHCDIFIPVTRTFAA